MPDKPFNDVDDIGHAADSLGLFIGNIDAKFFLDLNDDLHDIKRIGTEVSRQKCTR